MYFLSRLWRRWAASTHTGMDWSSRLHPFALVLIVVAF